MASIAIHDRYDVAPYQLHSQLERRLNSCGLQKASAAQWVGTIRNFQKKGVSETEIVWSGVLGFLDQLRSDTVPLVEIINHISHQPPCAVLLQRRVSEDYRPRLRFEQYRQPDSVAMERTHSGRSEARYLQFRDRTFGICIWQHAEEDPGLFGRLRYWRVTIPRGAKKFGARKVRRDFVSSTQARQYAGMLIDRLARRLADDGFIGQPEAVNRFPAYVLPGGLDYREWFITAPNLSQQYVGEHFPLPNIVAHVRTTERHLTNGQRILVLEEIQSDWNQELQAIRQRSSPAADRPVTRIWADEDSNLPANPYERHWVDVALRMMLLHAVHNAFDGLAWLPGRLHVERYPWANAHGLVDFYDVIVPKVVRKLGNAWRMQITPVSIQTTSRRFSVVRGEAGKWRVIDPSNMQSVSGDFESVGDAERYRATLEWPVEEPISALLLPESMQREILAKGLPYLGSIGDWMK